MTSPKPPQRQLDRSFEHYSKLYSTSTQKMIQGICAFVICFSVLGLSWSLPFPYLHFLGMYNSYFNWASFVIAISIYYYSTLSPLLSYLMLFLALIFTYLISVIEKNFGNHLQMGVLFGLILSISLLVHFFRQKNFSKEKAGTVWRFVWLGPIWILSLAFKKLNLNY